MSHFAKSAHPMRASSIGVLPPIHSDDQNAGPLRLPTAPRMQHRT
eukprot:SAG31_NODE_46275_length_255_cov_0.660256_1_plen_44_part_10